MLRFVLAIFVVVGNAVFFSVVPAVFGNVAVFVVVFLWISASASGPVDLSAISFTDISGYIQWIGFYIVNHKCQTQSCPPCSCTLVPCTL